jgi:hypothetical protein
MSEMQGPTPATERDVTFAWQNTKAAADAVGASPDDPEALAAAKSAFSTFVAASRSAKRGLEAGQ